MLCTARAPYVGSLSIATPHRDAHSSSASEWLSDDDVHVHELSLVRPQQDTRRGTLVAHLPDTLALLHCSTAHGGFVQAAMWKVSSEQAAEANDILVSTSAQAKAVTRRATSESQFCKIGQSRDHLRRVSDEKREEKCRRFPGVRLRKPLCTAPPRCCPRTSRARRLGIIGPHKCFHVKLLSRIIEYRPGVQWHTDVKRARVVIELFGLDVETSEPAPTLGIKYRPGKKTAQEVSCATSKTILRMRTEAQNRGAAGTVLYHAWNSPVLPILFVRI